MNFSEDYRKNMTSISQEMLTEMEKSYRDYQNNKNLGVARVGLEGEFKKIEDKYSDMIRRIKSESISLAEAMTTFAPQWKALEELVQVADTEMTKTMKGCIVHFNFEGCEKALSSAFKKNRIYASDLAVARATIIGRDMTEKVKIPEGIRCALKDLNVQASKLLISEKDIIYDLAEKKYVDKLESEYDVKLSSNEINFVGYAAKVLTENSRRLCEFTAKELMDFMTVLSEEYGVAVKHRTGEKIYDTINALWENHEFKDFNKEYYYHSRAIEHGVAPYVFQEMLRAPQGVVVAGRYNKPGIAYYYTADTREGAEKEVKLHHKGKDIQTVKLKTNHSARFLDLCKPARWGKEFLKHLRFTLNGSINNGIPREYLIPNFVSDCCKSIGYDGIIYYGGKDYNNYVVWRDGYYDFVEML